MQYEILRGDCISQMRAMPDNSFDSIVCDPPYELGFMGKSWDASGIAYSVEMWAEALRVLKPGGHLLAFSGSRTYHRMTCAIEDAGFEVRDQIMWVYGCLDEQTEVATAKGVMPCHKTKVGDLVMCYDAAQGQYSYQPILEIVEYEYSDTAYRLVGDFGEQVVSRNHRCIVERGGIEVFEYAEALQREARVPVLEDLPALQRALHGVYEGTGNPQQDLQPGLLGGVDRDREHGGETTRVPQGADGGLRGVLAPGMEAGRLAAQSDDVGMQPAMQRRATRGAVGNARAQGAGGLVGGGRGVAHGQDDRAEQSGLEGRGDVHQAQGPVRKPGHQVRAVPGAFPADGSKGRVRDGTPAAGGASDVPNTAPGRGGAPHKPRGDGQPAGESDAVCDERPAQGVRAWSGHKTAMVRVVPFHYTGKVWCLRVPTGAFVAVRNGVAFPTGNSGFPKSLDVSKAIDKARDDRDDIVRVTTFMADAAERAGITRGDVDRHMDTSDMAGWWLSKLRHRCQCPKWGQWLQLKQFLQLSDEMDAEVWRLNGRKGTPGEAWQSAEVLAVDVRMNEPSGIVGVGQGERVEVAREIKAANSDAARQWEGWGTALKPAHEPICVARKPLTKGVTVAANVLQFGTGALNIDGCRVPSGQDHADKCASVVGLSSNWNGNAYGEWQGERTDSYSPEGRWPANLIHDGSDEVLALFPNTTSGAMKASTQRAARDSEGWGMADEPVELRDAGTGSAARFFYQAKCAKSDRNSGLDGIMCVILEWKNSLEKDAKWGAEGRQVKLMVDTEHFPPRVIGAFGAGSKTATEWNTMLCGKNTMGQFRPASTSTIETKTKLTTPLAILNYFQDCITNENTPDASCETASGGSPADSAASCSALAVTTCEKMALALGASPAALPLQLRLSASVAVSGHPTVKPTDLMAYLVRLVTPPGGLVLDPFTGSGSTGKAAIREGFRFVGCELSDEYAWLADRRIENELCGGLL